MLEKDIEAAAVKWAKDNGWITYKFTSPNYRSVPDRIFLKGGVTAFIEFKRPGGKLTSGQEREIHKLELAGMLVHVAWSVGEAIGFLENVDPES